MKKNILFIVSSMQGGGAERVATLLCNYWTRNGHTVTLVPTFSGRGEYMYPLDDKVRLVYLTDRVGTFRKSLASKLLRLLALRSLVREINPDVAVSFLFDINVITLFITRGLNLPVVVSERVYPPAAPRRLMWSFLRRVSYPWAKAVIIQTELSAQWLKETCPKATSIIIPNPIVFPLPATLPNVPPEIIINSDTKVIISAGRLRPQKGFDILITAFSKLSEENQEWELVILGEGIERENLETQRNKLGLKNKIHLPGQVGNLSEWYKRGDIYAMSSRFEGFPNSLVEAMAYGLPVVSFDCDSGPRDIIEPQIDGILVNLKHGADGFSAALEKLISDKLMRCRMGDAAKSVQDKYSVFKIGKIWDTALGL